MQTALFKKKILFYTDADSTGSVQKMMFALAKNLNPDKYQIALVCPRFKQLDQWTKEWTANGFPVHKVKILLKHDPGLTGRLKKILTAEKPDLLHLHLEHPLDCGNIFGAVNRKTTKIVSTEHDPYALTGIKNNIKKNRLKKTDYTITVSDACREMMLKWHPQVKNKISTVHNGIDAEEFRAPLIHFANQHRQLIRQKLFKADPRDFVIISVASLETHKGQEYLLKAFAKVSQKKENTKLALIGEGPDRKKLEKKIKNSGIGNKVVLTGMQGEIARLLKSADLFVLPSIRESFGLALVEAMETGIPVIATRTGGIPEIIENNKSGILVEPGDADSLAAKIIDLIENQPLRQKLTYVAGHEVKKFNAEDMAAKTEKIYDYLLNQ